VNNGEYKVMGMAPYGEPKYVDKIYDNLIEVASDGSFWMNMDYFSYHYSDHPIIRSYAVPMNTMQISQRVYSLSQKKSY
jgi:carbamoyltransferase